MPNIFFLQATAERLGPFSTSIAYASAVGQSALGELVPAAVQGVEFDVPVGAWRGGIGPAGIQRLEESELHGADGTPT